MPYKEKLKNPSLKPRKKPQYKVANWTEYNKSLKRRGELSLYFPHGELKPQFINEDPYVRGISGRQATVLSHPKILDNNIFVLQLILDILMRHRSKERAISYKNM